MSYLKIVTSNMLNIHTVYVLIEARSILEARLLSSSNASSTNYKKE
jgi:hypothetical protein